MVGVIVSPPGGRNQVFLAPFSLDWPFLRQFCACLLPASRSSREVPLLPPAGTAPW